MVLSPTDQLHLNATAGYLQLGDAMDAWHELELIAPLNRAQTKVLSVRLAVCRALKMWEVADDVARTLIKREPENIMHVVALAEVMGHREGPVAAAAVYEFAIDRFPDFALLLESPALELIKARQVEDANQFAAISCEPNPSFTGLTLGN